MNWMDRLHDNTILVSALYTNIPINDGAIAMENAQEKTKPYPQILLLNS